MNDWFSMGWQLSEKIAAIINSVWPSNATEQQIWGSIGSGNYQNQKWLMLTNFDIRLEEMIS